jgi:hypothetical protein
MDRYEKVKKATLRPVSDTFTLVDSLPPVR